MSEECPCGEQSRKNCTDCQDLPEWYFDKPNKIICSICGMEFQKEENRVIHELNHLSFCEENKK